MIQFEEKDRQSWLHFLNTESGAKGLAFLRESKIPDVRTTGLPHEMHFDAGVSQGFRDAIDEVEILSRLKTDTKRKTAMSPSLQSTRINQESDAT